MDDAAAKDGEGDLKETVQGGYHQLGRPLGSSRSGAHPRAHGARPDGGPRR